MDDSMDRNLDELHLGPELDIPEEDDQTETSIHQNSYVTVLKEEDIWRHMENKIQSVTVEFSLSKAEATLVLSYFHWDVAKIRVEWSHDEKNVRDCVGLLERPVLESPPDEKVVMIFENKSSDKEFFCGVCSQSHPTESSASVSCGHRVCTYCRKGMICNFIGHINNVINESPAFEWNLWLKCPYESCRVSVGRDMIEEFATDEEKSKYDRYLFRSYVDDKKMMKCCPVPGRSCTTDLSSDSESSEVLCLCFLSFCWNCCKDSHSPVDCETAAKWLAMIISGYQNPNWLRRGDLTEHGEEICNNDVVPYEEIDQQWRMGEVSADRYKDCYENWNINDSLMRIAKEKLQQLRTVDISVLSKKQLPTEQELEFIIEAGLQIIESRRILKWTYAYQYYLPEDKQDLFKIWQDNVKLLLKELDDCIETKLPWFLNAEGVSEKFSAFCFKLTGLIRTTRKYNETLIKDLEDGLTNDARKVTKAYNSDQASCSDLNHDD